MKKLVLLFLVLIGFFMSTSYALADRGHDFDQRDNGYHDDRGHDFGHERDHGWYNPGDRDHHYFHGWVWGFPPPIWVIPGVTDCREYYTQRMVGVDVYGHPVYVMDQHVECQNTFGIWIFIR
jgi:hypothetical protein